MNQNPFDSFPYLQQMNDQFRKMFGDDFVKNLMNAMQTPNWGPMSGGAPTGPTPFTGNSTGESGASSRFGDSQPQGAGNAADAQNGMGWMNNLPQWNPLSQQSPGQSARKVYPAADIYETRHEVVLAVEIPGVDRASDIRLSVFSDRVTVKGDVKRKYTRAIDDELALSERFVGSFERTFSVPTRVRRQHAKATYSQGILEVRLLKEGKSGESDGSMIDVDFV